MNEVLRKEKKYLINSIQVNKLSMMLANVLHEDEHNKNDGYSIRSLYFDSIDDRDYQDKEDGVEVRRKIRLRCYGINAEYAMLEMKQKQGDNQKKRSLKMEKEDAKELIRGNYGILLKFSNPFASECYALMNMECYKPKAVVEYKRKAYIAKENNIRITIDNNIIATESCFDIFSDNLLQNSVYNPYLAVLEVKYNGFLLSYIKDIINNCNEIQTSVSKYILSRTISKHVVF